MAEESKIEQNFNAAYGVAGVVQGDQIINPPQTPQAEKPAESPNNLNRALTGAVNFVGREDAMTQLHHQLQQQERIAITALSNENIVLKPAKECFRQGWQDAMTGNIQPISELWEGIDAE